MAIADALFFRRPKGLVNCRYESSLLLVLSELRGFDERPVFGKDIPNSWGWNRL